MGSHHSYVQSFASENLQSVLKMQIPDSCGPTQPTQSGFPIPWSQRPIKHSSLQCQAPTEIPKGTQTALDPWGLFYTLGGYLGKVTHIFPVQPLGCTSLGSKTLGEINIRI